MKIISYSLFGYNKERQENCFDFNSYLRGVTINYRLNRLIYPDWTMLVNMDTQTFLGLENFWNAMCTLENFKIQVYKEAPLCEEMLWRLKPCFWEEPRPTHLLCRDLDSPTTYREAQAVTYWMNRDKTLHAITDSISHNLPLLGGMIGIIPKYFTDKFKTWNDLIYNKGIDYSIKGSDQTLLNQYVYPAFAKHGEDSITEHFILGMPNSFLSDCHNTIQPLDLDIPFSMSESNTICGHIGAAGWYEPALLKFLYKYKEQFEDIVKIEQTESKTIFYWINEI